MSDDLIKGILKTDFHNITPFDLEEDKNFVFDLSDKNEDLNQIDLNDESSFNDFIFDTLAEQNADFGIGKYKEDRLIYKRSEMFSGEEPRSIHLGLDIWAPAGTEVFAPCNSIVHSFADNHQHGDYGPTIILQHELNTFTFYTLYGHLSQDSISGLTIGQKFRGGELIGYYGSYNENVHWPPHLHFQVITDIGNYKGDFPGVCRPSEKDKWLRICLDPNLLVGLTL